MSQYLKGLYTEQHYVTLWEDGLFFGESILQAVKT